MFHFCCLPVLVTYLIVLNHYRRDVSYFWCYEKMLPILYWAASFVLNFWNALMSQVILSFLEQFLALIPRYTLFTYFTDNGFKSLLGRANFIIILYHSLYVTLIPFMTDIASNIQQASIGDVDWQALLTSIRCKKMMFWILSGSQIWKC